ncbi:hypothetical protein BKA66DRAFT_286896 [Pyrenochaeta sp. MPI-SDFR-AT-0127]|nr:hypothetical protein BKA66DRAFT_286896 [Pyrenochaeta sp. MPI-SDFR-AT-0127]
MVGLARDVLKREPVIERIPVTLAYDIISKDKRHEVDEDIAKDASEDTVAPENTIEERGLRKPDTHGKRGLRKPDTHGKRGLRKPDTHGKRGLRKPDTHGKRGLRKPDTHGKRGLVERAMELLLG